MVRTPDLPPDPVRAANCPRRFTILSDGGVRTAWECGAVSECGRGSGEWIAMDVRVLEDKIDQHHAHRHHPHVPHRTKVGVR